MKTLGTCIIKRKFQYDQLLREGQFAIYSQSLGGKLMAYEVIKIKQAPAHERGGVPFPAMELYPSDEQFGVNGWSFAIFGDLSDVAYKKAFAKFERLKSTQT